MLATSKMRQTKVENPSEEPDFLMSRYCGMYGTTPPKIIAHSAMNVTKLASAILNNFENQSTKWVWTQDGYSL